VRSESHTHTLNNSVRDKKHRPQQLTGSYENTGHDLLQPFRARVANILMARTQTVYKFRINPFVCPWEFLKSKIRFWSLP